MSTILSSNLKPPYLAASEDLRSNTGQWKAYESKGNCVILAGPGSGKTKTLTIKMARILSEDIQYPRGIACITYSNQCAKELKLRLNKLAVQESSKVFIGTVHSFCLTQVVIPYARLAGIKLPKDLKVATQKDQALIFEKSVKQIVSNQNPIYLRVPFDRYRRTLLDRDDENWENDEELAKLVVRYEQLLVEKGLIDFDGMVLIGLQLIEQNEWVRKALHARFPVLFIDEYQDLGLPLHRIVLSLCFKAGIRILAVGDPDQSIYGFIGAKPKVLLDLASMENIECVNLKMNYRCGRIIVDASKVTLTEERDFKSCNSNEGTIHFYKLKNGIKEQAQFICKKLIPDILSEDSTISTGDIGILYIDKYDGDVIADVAKNEGYKYIRTDKGNPYQKTIVTSWLEDCAKWCSGGWKVGQPRLAALTYTWMSLNRNIIGDEAQRLNKRRFIEYLFKHRDSELLLSEWLKSFCDSLLNESLELDPILRQEKTNVNQLLKAAEAGGALEDFHVSDFGGQHGSPDHLHLTTLHSAKGLEFDAVIIMGLEQGRIPRYRATDREILESRRLFYVGITRAKSEVHMTYSGWYQNSYGSFQNGPSKFLIEIYKFLNKKP